MALTDDADGNIRRRKASSEPDLDWEEVFETELYATDSKTMDLIRPRGAQHAQHGTATDVTDDDDDDATCEQHRRRSPSDPDWEAIESELYATLQTLLATKNESEVVRSEECGNITVRQTFADTTMISFGEVQFVEGIHPDDVLDFYDNWADCVTNVNPLVRRARVVGEGENYQCIRYESHLPFPLSDRCFYSVKFVKKDVTPGEHVLLMSEKGNEKFVAETYTQKDKERFVLGQCHLSSWIFKPVRDEAGNVVGSCVAYFISADACGVVPHWLQSRKGPSTVSEAIHGLIEYLKAKKGL